MKNLQNGNDYISGMKLPKGANLHHMDEANYTDLNPDKFVFLGREMHKTVHFLYRYFRKDKTCIDRLVFVLEKMKIYEKESEK